MATFWPNPGTPSHNLRNMFLRIAAENSSKEPGSTNGEAGSGTPAAAVPNGEVKQEASAGAGDIEMRDVPVATAGALASGADVQATPSALETKEVPPAA